MGMAFGIDRDVRRLQVAMQNPACMGIVDGLGVLGQEVHLGLGIVLERVDLVGEVAPLDELHAEVALAFVIADLVDQDDPFPRSSRAPVHLAWTWHCSIIQQA